MITTIMRLRLDFFSPGEDQEKRGLVLP